MRQALFLFVVVIFSYSVAYAVGESCVPVSFGPGHVCFVPATLNDRINYYLVSSQVGAIYQCSGVWSGCLNYMLQIPVGTWSGSLTISRIDQCGAQPCSMVALLSYGYSLGGMGNGVMAPGASPITFFDDLFDSQFESLVFQVVGFLSNPFVVGVLLSVIALIFVPRIVRLLRRILVRS